MSGAEQSEGAGSEVCGVVGSVTLGVDPGLVCTAMVALFDKKIIYRGNVTTPTAWSDEERCKIICRDVLEAARKIPGLDVGSVWVEGYEYQGPRTHTKNAIRISMLIGEIRATLRTHGFNVHTVDRTVWGRALGVTTDKSLARLLASLTGLKPKNAHERDAGAIAKYGQAWTGQHELCK